MDSPASSQDLKRDKGQLSIFLGIALFIVMAMIAFVVNVGLFVKAKINLQNATDAAAWAGAAVQARQLSNIAYVNYHFRQIFKEWMFKYYILGQIGGLASAGSSGILPGDDGGTTNFRSYSIQFPNTPPSDGDKFNVPSICLHVESDNCTDANGNVGNCANICATTSIPGLPRFDRQHLPVISKANKDFIDQLVAKKSKDCSDRTDLNFQAALAWAYGSGGAGATSSRPPLSQVTAWGPGPPPSSRP